MKQLYAIRKLGWGNEIEYFNFCTEEWVSERCFDNFCVCNEGLAKHYAERLSIKEIVAFNVSIEEDETYDKKKL